jgi:hypothetical protein
MKGRCYCGEIHYRITADPVMKGQCHCRECQYISGGGPNFFMVVPEAGYEITRGVPRPFARKDLENPRTRHFCPACGTHLTTRIPGLDVVIVKVGTLDDPARDYGDSDIAIYMKDAQPFHVVGEGKPCFEERPPR